MPSDDKPREMAETTKDPTGPGEEPRGPEEELARAREKLDRARTELDSVRPPSGELPPEQEEARKKLEETQAELAEARAELDKAHEKLASVRPVPVDARQPERSRLVGMAIVAAVVVLLGVPIALMAMDCGVEDWPRASERGVTLPEGQGD